MAFNKSSAIINEVKKAVTGKDDCILRIYLSLLAGGNILLEGESGCGKSTIVKSFAKALSLDTASIRFNSEMNISDLLGVSVYNKQTSAFEFKKGAVMCNLFVADDFCSGAPKVNSLMLDAMDTLQISVDGAKLPLPNPFNIVATQSRDFGELSEFQLDRFMMKIVVDRPTPEEERDILLNRKSIDPIHLIKPMTTKKEFVEMKTAVSDVYAADSVLEYVAKLISATRRNKNILRGASSRVSIDLVNASKAAAWVVGRDYVVPGDVIAIFHDVVSHRVKFAEGVNVRNVLNSVVESVVTPNIGKNKKSR